MLSTGGGQYTAASAEPGSTKKTFLKPFMRSAEFCSTCHKVSIPGELNKYKDFLRGQNHYDTYLLSGVSGHGARSFYYPEQAKTTCAACHMPLKWMDHSSRWRWYQVLSPVSTL